MNITLLANRDVASCLALNLLLPRLDGHNCTVYLSSQVGGSGSRPPALQHLAFYEQGLFNDLLFPLLDRQPVQPASLKTFTGLGNLIGSPVTTLNRINSGIDHERFLASAPDLVLSIRYGTILKNAVIATPRHGVLNLHSGLLPGYKGVMATFRALANGEAQVGTTLHRIVDDNIDTGPVLGTTLLDVNHSRSYLWHVLTLYEQGVALIHRAVEAISGGTPLVDHPQAEGGAYYSFPTEAELAAFDAMGKSLVEPADILEIARKFMTDQAFPRLDE